MRTLQDFAKDNKIAYTTACLWAKQGKIKTFWGEKIVKRKVRVRYVLEEENVN